MIRAVEMAQDIRLPYWLGVIVALIMPLAFASAWEIVEFASDELIYTTAQHGLVDTMLYMIAAAIGAALTVIFVRFMTPKSVRPKAF